MTFDLQQQSASGPGPGPSGAPNESRQQEISNRENPGPPAEPSIYPGQAPGFFPYAQYPSLTWQPRVDIFEDHDSFLVVVEVPGVRPEQLNVENSSNLLLISGQNDPVPNSGSVSSGNVSLTPRHQERVCGSFSRGIHLPPHASADRAEASCRNGVLEIKIPKKGASPGRPAQHPAQQRPAKQRSAEPAKAEAKKRTPGGKSGASHYSSKL
jgi:HSP20 family protein